MKYSWDFVLTDTCAFVKGLYLMFLLGPHEKYSEENSFLAFFFLFK